MSSDTPKTLYASKTPYGWRCKQAVSGKQFAQICIKQVESETGDRVPLKQRKLFQPDFYYNRDKQLWYWFETDTVYGKKLPPGAPGNIEWIPQ